MGDEEKDYHNFSTSPIRRLPTLNGTQAFRIAVTKTKPISTGLKLLDELLAHSEARNLKGIQRGSITEIYGPPGVGKTTFAIQIAVNAIVDSDDHNRVLWIDTASSLMPERLKQIADGFQTSEPHRSQESTSQVQATTGRRIEENFQHLRISQLPHLLALLLHPPPSFPPEKTSLIILDDVSNFLLSGLSSGSRLSSKSPSNSATQLRAEQSAKAAAMRRTSILSSFASGLQKLAAATNTAIIVTTKTSSGIKAGQKAILRPSLNSPQWTSNMTTRMALYRDDWPVIDYHKISEEEARSERDKRKLPLRIAEIERSERKDVRTGGIQFMILKTGIHAANQSQISNQHVVITRESTEAEIANDDDNAVSTDTEIAIDTNTRLPEDSSDLSINEHRAQKRKAFEIADSEEEDGADDEEVDLPPMPTKFTGFQPSSQLNQAIDSNSHQKTKTQALTIDKPEPIQNEAKQEPSAKSDMLFDEFEND